MAHNPTALLSPGETLEQLNMEGWVVLSDQLRPGDQIIVDYGDPARVSDDRALFDRPVRAIVDAVNSINNVGLTLLTAGAKDRRGHEWPVGQLDGWYDVKWHTYKVVPTRALA